MNRRWIPFLATTAALALAVAAPAQDRGRSRGDGGGGGGHSSPPRSEPSRSEPSRSQPTRSDPVRSEPSRTPPSRNEPSRSEPSRTWPTRSGPTRSEPTRSEPTRTEPGRNQPSWPARTDDRRDRTPTSSGRPTRSDPTSGDRRDPFGRSGDRTGSTRSADRPVFPTNDRSGNYARSRDYDGRTSNRGASRPVQYTRPPSHLSIDDQIRRTRGSTVYRDHGTSFAFGGVYGGLRVGYVSYGNDWGRYRGGYFGYPYYVYDPFVANAYCVASPWYGYSYLPPYVDSSRVIVVHDYPNWVSDGWSTYDYRYDARDRRNVELNDALDDLRDAFARNSTRYAERLVPNDGQIAIFNDGKYDYSMNAEDFDKMFLDGIEQSKTTRYEVVEVRTHGDEVRVRARHEFEDSWGEPQVAYHNFTLRRDRGGNYVIREFGTE